MNLARVTAMPLLLGWGIIAAAQECGGDWPKLRVVGQVRDGDVLACFVWRSVGQPWDVCGQVKVENYSNDQVYRYWINYDGNTANTWPVSRGTTEGGGLLKPRNMLGGTIVCNRDHGTGLELQATIVLKPYQ